MKQRFTILLMALAAASAVTAFDRTESDDVREYLTIGDPAPSLKSATWLKGSPVKSFEKGRVYVVEFWATWCGPCKENIPHLTEMAVKYRDKVSIIGISIWENLDMAEADPLKKVKSFVTSQGSQMEYLVAADGPDNAIADAWMKPASEGGIPCSFLVDGEGRIAWIGHPARMEAVIGQLLAGTYDMAKAREAREIELKHSRPIGEFLAQRKYKELLQAIDVAVADKPSLEYSLTYSRFVALFHTDLNAGKAYAQKILKESEEAPGAYQMMTSIFAAYDDLTPEAYRYGVELSAAAMKRSPENIMLRAIEAEIFFHLKDKDKAIASIEKAVAAAKASEFSTPEFMKQLEGSLAKYRAMG